MPHPVTDIANHPDAKSFVSAIKDSDAVFDPTPRLVFADWLDENGMPDHSHAVRTDAESGHDWETRPLLNEAGLVPFDHQVLAHAISDRAIQSKLASQGYLYQADIAHKGKARRVTLPTELADEAYERALAEPEHVGSESEDEVYNSHYRVYSDGSALRSDDQMQETFSPEFMARWHEGHEEPIDPASYPASRIAARLVAEREKSRG